MLKFISLKILAVCLLFLAVSTGFSTEPGSTASDFTINNFDGKSYTLSNSGGKATVIMFWSTECPNVQPYTDRINALANEYMPQGIVFWGVNSNQTEDVGTVETHAKEKNYPFPMLKDAKSDVANLFNAQRTPEVFMIDNSTMQVIYHGRIDDNREASKVTSHDLKNAMDEFLAGKPISVSETKSFGCGIKR